MRTKNGAPRDELKNGRGRVSGSSIMGITLLIFSLLVSEDFWVLLSFLSDRSAKIPCNKCAENTGIAGRIKRQLEILTNWRGKG